MSEFKFGINKLLGQSSQQTEQLAEVLGRVTILGSQITPSNEAIQLETEKKQLSDEWYLERDSLMLTIQTLRDENDQLASLKHTKVQECQDALKKIEQLENENLRLRDGLKEKLSEQKEMLETAHREESEDLKLVINELKAKEEKLTSQQENVIRDLKAKFLSNENVIHNLRKDIEEKTGQLDVACQERALVEEELLHANHQIASLNEDFSRTKKEWSNGTGQGSQASVIDQVKTIMNKVYKEIAKQFLPEQTYSLKDIKLTVGAVIRVCNVLKLTDELIIIITSLL